MTLTLALVVRRDAPGTDLRPIALAGGLGAVVLVGCWWYSGKNASAIDPTWTPEIQWAKEDPPRHFDLYQLNWVVTAGPGSDREPIKFEKYRVRPVASTFVLVTLTFTLGLLACGLSRSYPSLGMKPLGYMGGMLLLAVVWSNISSRQSISPVARHFGIVRGTPGLGQVNESLQKFEEETRRAEDMKKQGRNDEAEAAWQRAESAMEKLNRLAPQVVQNAAMAEVFRDGPIWPVALAGLVFLYLWWLAALLFDLTFVWHRYIRHSVGLDRLKAMIEGKA